MIELKDTKETQSMGLCDLLGIDEGGDSDIQELKPDELTRSLKERALSEKKLAREQQICPNPGLSSIRKETEQAGAKSQK